MRKIIVNPKNIWRIFQGYQWIYDKEIVEKEKIENSGEFVEIYTTKNKFLGIGFINPNSSLSVRIVSTEKEEINKEFFGRRIKEAIELREKIYGKIPEGCRLIYSESDFLSGIVVDKFSNVLVIKVTSLLGEYIKPWILESLVEYLNPKGIIYRADDKVREKEGLEMYKEWVFGEKENPVIFKENDVAYFYVDVVEGQKTGHFLDQRENRLEIMKYTRGADVLDIFSYTGGFGIYAGISGANSITFIDNSEKALSLLEMNIKANNITSKIKIIKDDAFDRVRKLISKGAKFDVVILDPPAFTKSKESKEGAIEGYRDINLHAMKLVRRGGIFITSSCTSFVTQEELMELLVKVATEIGRIPRFLEIKGQAKDHPILPSMKHTWYLKFFVIKLD